MAGSNSRFIFIYLRNPDIVFHYDCSGLHTHQQCTAAFLELFIHLDINPLLVWFCWLPGSYCQLLSLPKWINHSDWFQRALSLKPCRYINHAKSQWTQCERSTVSRGSQIKWPPKDLPTPDHTPCYSHRFLTVTGDRRPTLSIKAFCIPEKIWGHSQSHLPNL